MQCRLILDTEERRERAFKMGIKDVRKRYEIEDMVKGDCLFAATGVTSGAMLRGVRFRSDVIETETVVMRSITGTVRWIRADHRELADQPADRHLSTLPRKRRPASPRDAASEPPDRRRQRRSRIDRRAALSRSLAVDCKILRAASGASPGLSSSRSAAIR